MGTVLAILELDGDTDRLLAAGTEVEQRLGTPDGLLARIVAPTESGIVLMQLWESPEARERNASNPGHHAALEASGLMALVTEARPRAVTDAVLQVFGDA